MEYVARPTVLRLVKEGVDNQWVEDRERIRQLLLQTLKQLRETCNELDGLAGGSFYASSLRIWIGFLEGALRRWRH